MLARIATGEGAVDFISAVKSCLGQYATFRGRAPRSEYWFFALFSVLVSVVAGIIDGVIGNPINPATSIVTVALLVPGIAVAVRRLHDRDRSGWWYLLIFVPLVGAIVLLVWFCLKGTAGPNRFGDDPLDGTPLPQPAAA